MKTKKNTSVKAALITLGVIVALCLLFMLYINWALGAPIKPTEILPGENGKCSERLKEFMRDWYGVYIPDCADFVGGYFNNAPRDACVYVAFDIKLSEWDGYYDGISEKDLQLLLTRGEDFFCSDTAHYGSEKNRVRFEREYHAGTGFCGPHTKGFSYLDYSDLNDAKADGIISFVFCATGYPSSVEQTINSGN